MSRLRIAVCAMCLCDALTTNGSAHRALPSSAPRMLWHIEDEGRGTPAVCGKTVYFLSKHHEVVAAHATTGRLRWRAWTGVGGDATAGSRVVCADDRVVAGDTDLVAFDFDGRVAWRFGDESGASGIYLGDAVLGMVFAGSINGLVSAVDLEKGRRRWSARAGDDQTTVFAPVADERIVVAGFTSFGEQSGGVAAWDTRTGRERWRVRLGATGSPGGVTGGPVLTERFVAVTSRDGTIAVIERETGRVTRVLPAVGEAAIPGGEPVSQDFRALLALDRGRALLAGSLTGVVILYDAETGRERWRHRPVAASIGFAIAEDGQETAYLPYLSGPLVAVDTKTGAERWRTRSDDGFSWAPRAWHGALYASASRTGFFAFVR